MGILRDLPSGGNIGRLAQLARALLSHSRGRWFESNIAHVTPRWRPCLPAAFPLGDQGGSRRPRRPAAVMVLATSRRSVRVQYRPLRSPRSEAPGASSFCLSAAAARSGRPRFREAGTGRRSQARAPRYDASTQDEPRRTTGVRRGSSMMAGYEPRLTRGGDGVRGLRPPAGRPASRRRGPRSAGPDSRCA